MVIVYPEVTFYKKNGNPRQGYYLDDNLEPNITNYFIKAVQANWDCFLIVGGMEGVGKTTTAMAISRYMDPTFPGEPLNDGTPRRKCDRIVFTYDQFMKAIDEAKPGQAIMFDEAVTAMNAQDAGSDMQKTLIKKMTMIRKKHLYILVLMPNIFMFRRYFAVSRARALIHFYTPDGIERGFFKFYNYEAKRKLYFGGFKNWDMNCVQPSFRGRSTDTMGFFVNEAEYEAKKDAATLEFGNAPDKKFENSEKVRKFKEARDKMCFVLYHCAEGLKGRKGVKYSMDEFRAWLKENVGLDESKASVTRMYNNGRKYLLNNSTVGNQESDSDLDLTPD
jgi:DNA polymerase III delta prime subunit